MRVTTAMLRWPGEWITRARCLSGVRQPWRSSGPTQGKEYPVRRLLDSVDTPADKREQDERFGVRIDRVEKLVMTERKQDFEFDSPKFEGPVFFGDIQATPGSPSARSGRSGRTART